VQTGTFRVDFATDQPEGMYKLTATLDEQSDSFSFYYAPANNGQFVDLTQLNADGMQIDTRRYPEIVTYFGIVSLEGIATKLSGDLDVEVFQDGQQVENFAMAPVDTAREPVTVALAVDVSGSMDGQPMAGARAAAAEFVRQLGENDAACLYVFATQVQQLVDCTTDHASVISAIESLQTIDDTALYDALTRVTSDHIQRSGRLAIVVLSDGADTKSQATLDQAFTQVRESSIPVYTIGLLSPQFDGTLLQRLSDEADAIYLEAPTVENMSALYSRINEQLINQYRISFASLFPSRREGEVLIRIRSGDEAIEIKRTFTVQS
jgi:hypothetical protein